MAAVSGHGDGRGVPGPFRRAEVDRVRFGICPALRFEQVDRRGWRTEPARLRRTGTAVHLGTVDFRLSSPRNRRLRAQQGPGRQRTTRGETLGPQAGGGGRGRSMQLPIGVAAALTGSRSTLRAWASEAQAERRPSPRRSSGRHVPESLSGGHHETGSSANGGSSSPRVDRNRHVVR